MQNKNFIVLIVTLVVIAGWIGWSYNTVVTQEELANVAWAQVESNIQRRLDLLPNLVRIVKRYAKYEDGLLTKLTVLRAQELTELNAMKSSNVNTIELIEKSNNSVVRSLSRVMVIAEKYPQLNSSEQFLQLQAQIEGAENRINITRKLYNGAAERYNSCIRTIPTSVVAYVFGFTEKQYFRLPLTQH